MHSSISTVITSSSNGGSWFMESLMATVERHVLGSLICSLVGWSYGFNRLPAYEQVQITMHQLFLMYSSMYGRNMVCHHVWEVIKVVETSMWLHIWWLHRAPTADRSCGDRKSLLWTSSLWLPWHLNYRSTQNSRIEHIWVKLGTQFVCWWCGFFVHCERCHHLNIENINHLWLLQRLFLGPIDGDCEVFHQEWNLHPISGPTTNNKSPQVCHVYWLYPILLTCPQGLVAYQSCYTRGVSWWMWGYPSPHYGTVLWCPWPWTDPFKWSNWCRTSSWWGSRGRWWRNHRRWT